MRARLLLCLLLGIVPLQDAAAVKRWFFFANAQAQALEPAALPEEVRVLIVVSKYLRRTTVSFTGTTIAADSIRVHAELQRADGRTERYETSLAMPRMGRWEGHLHRADGGHRRFRLEPGDRFLFRFHPRNASGDFPEGHNLVLGATLEGRARRTEGSSSANALEVTSAPAKALAEAIEALQAGLAWSFGSGAAFKSAAADLPRKVTVRLLASAGEGLVSPCLRYLQFQDRGARGIRARVTVRSEDGTRRRRTLELEPPPPGESDWEACFPPALELREGDLAKIRFRFRGLQPGRLFNSILLTFVSESAPP